MEKICTKCKINKSLDMFNKHKHGKLGITSECKICQAQREKKYKDSRKEKTKLYNSSYNSLNEESIKEYAKIYSKNRYNTDILYRFKSNMRSHINVRLKNFLKNKKGKTLDYLGCSWDFFINYLESQFTPEMNWGNYGSKGYWEIDHIVPLSKGGSFHYTNCRPLSIIENRKKGNKLLEI
jgi:5-methylcytosine-specific restriction endonuclease McrA